MMKSTAALAAAFLLFTIGPVAAADEAATINKIIAQLNADAKTPVGKTRALESISKSTRIPISTLQTEQSQTALTVGELYIAHAIASASGKPFSVIAAAHRSGKTWPQIAAAYNVSLGGTNTKTAAQTGPNVRNANERDRQQTTPSTSRVGKQTEVQSRNPIDRWP